MYYDNNEKRNAKRSVFRLLLAVANRFFNAMHAPIKGKDVENDDVNTAWKFLVLVGKSVPKIVALCA